MLIHFLIGGRGWIGPSLANQSISAEQILVVAGRGKPDYECIFREVDISLNSSPAMLLDSLIRMCDSHNPSKVAITLNSFTVPEIGGRLTQPRYEVIFEEFLRLLFNRLDGCSRYRQLAISVVVVSSVFSRRSPSPLNYDQNPPAPAPASYGAAKAYLDQLIRFYAVNRSSCEPERRFNSLVLGFILKPNSVANSAFASSCIARIPVSRFGSPEDVGNAVSFLHSDASGFINGISLVCDGGSSCLI